MINKSDIEIQMINVRYGTITPIKDELESLMKNNSNFKSEEFISFKKPTKQKVIPVVTGIKNKQLDKLVNIWLMSKSKDNKDTKPLARAIKNWCDFIELNLIQPFEVPMNKMRSPTYGYKEELKLRITDNILASSTASLYINEVKNFYKWLDANKLLEANPFFKNEMSLVDGKRKVQSTDLRIRTYKKHGPSLNPMNHQTTVRFKSILETIPQRNRLLNKIMLESGLRLQEVLTLNIDLFDEDKLFESNSDAIRGIQLKPSLGVMTKNSTPREMFITRSLYEEIIDYINSDEYEIYSIKHEINQEELKSEIKLKQLETGIKLDEIENEIRTPLFLTRNGKPLSKSTFYKYYSDLKQIYFNQYGVKLVHSPHDLRATFCTNFLNTLMTELKLSASSALALTKLVMGHKYESTTMKYVKYLEHKDMLDEVACVLDLRIIEAFGSNYEL